MQFILIIGSEVVLFIAIVALIIRRYNRMA